MNQKIYRPTGADPEQWRSRGEGQKLCPPLAPKWNYTVYRGLWRATILSPSQPLCSPLSPPCRPLILKSLATPLIQDFSKEGAPKLRTDRTSAPVGTGGVWGDVAPQKRRKILIFKVNSHNLVHSFCLGHPHKVRRPISAKNRGGAHWMRPPLNLPLA